jgi:hypothetical protein
MSLKPGHHQNHHQALHPAIGFGREAPETDSPSLESGLAEEWGNSHTGGGKYPGNPTASEGTQDSTIQGLPPLLLLPDPSSPTSPTETSTNDASLRHLSKGIPLPMAPDLPGKASYIRLPLQSIPWLHRMTIHDPNLLRISDILANPTQVDGRANPRTRPTMKPLELPEEILNFTYLVILHTRLCRKDLLAPLLRSRRLLSWVLIFLLARE